LDTCVSHTHGRYNARLLFVVLCVAFIYMH
jgi:hypothetical protein